MRDAEVGRTEEGLAAMAENSPPADDSSRFSLQQVDEIIANRAIIEQAKGILMLVHGIDAGDAFELLRAQSRSSQVKLLLVAQRLVQHVSALSTDARLDVQAACGALPLSTSHALLDGASKTDWDDPHHGSLSSA